jgi:hypothetical protein
MNKKFGLQASQNDSSKPFRNNEMAGVDRPHGCFKETSVHLFEKAMPTGMNKVSVSNVFDLLTKVINEHHLVPDKICSVGKMNITVNPKGYSSILKLKGCRPVGSLGSAEEGGTVRGVMCISASEVFMPLYVDCPQEKNAARFSTECMPLSVG